MSSFSLLKAIKKLHATNLVDNGSGRCSNEHHPGPLYHYVDVVMDVTITTTEPQLWQKRVKTSRHNVVHKLVHICTKTYFMHIDVHGNVNMHIYKCIGGQPSSCTRRTTQQNGCTSGAIHAYVQIPSQHFVSNMCCINTYWVNVRMSWETTLWTTTDTRPCTQTSFRLNTWM